MKGRHPDAYCTSDTEQVLGIFFSRGIACEVWEIVRPRWDHLSRECSAPLSAREATRI